MNDKYVLQKLFRLIGSDVSFVLENMKAVPLFHRCKTTMNDVRISDEVALADSILYPQMINLESITSKKLPTSPYTFRRGSEEASLFFEVHHDWHPSRISWFRATDYFDASRKRDESIFGGREDLLQSTKSSRASSKD